jgi:hypothetical protein
MCREESAGMPSEKARVYCGCVISRMDDRLSLQAFASISAEARNKRSMGLPADKAAMEIPELRRLVSDCRSSVLAASSLPSSDRMANCVTLMKRAISIGDSAAMQKCGCFSAFLEKQLPDLSRDEQSRSLANTASMSASEQAAVLTRVLNASQAGYAACGIPQSAQ